MPALAFFFYLVFRLGLFFIGAAMIYWNGNDILYYLRQDLPVPFGPIFWIGLALATYLPWRGSGSSSKDSDS